MSTIAKLTGADFDSMVERGAFDRIGPMKIEFIHGEMRFTNPASPIHVMSKILEGRYQSIEILVPPNTLAPQSRREAILNLEDLFSVN